MQKKTSQRDSFQKKKWFHFFFLIVDKEASKDVKHVLDYLWMAKRRKSLCK